MRKSSDEHCAQSTAAAEEDTPILRNLPPWCFAGTMDKKSGNWFKNYTKAAEFNNCALVLRLKLLKSTKNTYMQGVQKTFKINTNYQLKGVGIGFNKVEYVHMVPVYQSLFIVHL